MTVSRIGFEETIDVNCCITSAAFTNPTTKTFILSEYSTIKCQNTFIFDENYNFLYFLGVVVVGFAVVVGLAVVVVVFVVVVVVEVVVGFGVVGIGVVVGAPVVDGPGVGVS